MTDYIEDSLDRLEEEEERSWDWHEAAAVLSARSSEKSRQAAAQSQNGTAAPETAAVRERRREREPDLPASAPSAATSSRRPASSELSGLEGTAPPGQPAAAGLYWGLARLRAAAAYGTSAPGRTVVRVPAPACEETPGLRPAELDRLFQRDARRYDGRFTLF